MTHLAFKVFNIMYSNIFRTWNSVIEKPKFWRWATLRLDRGNYREIIQSLQNEDDQSRASNVQKIRISLQEEEEDNSWVLNILQDLVTAVQDDDSHLKSLDIAGSGASSVDWTSLPVDLLAQFLVSLESSFDLIRTNPTYELRVGTSTGSHKTTSSVCSK